MSLTDIFSLITCSFAYKPGSPTVLSDVSFRVEDKDKLVVVGRTGAGKTSLVNVLLRLYPVQQGVVKFSGADIHSLALRRVREAITVIPQDGGLLGGSLRFNLDPLQKLADEQLWESLEKVGLRNFVSGTSKKLELEIEDGGRNLSAGQRQLVCMARALLR